MDRGKARALRAMVETAVQAALKGQKEFKGLAVSLGNASFTDTAYTLKVVIAETAKDGTLQTPEATTYKFYERSLGLHPLSTTVTYAGKAWKLCGYVPNRRKYPVLAKNAAGKMFKLPLRAAQTKTAVKF